MAGKVFFSASMSLDGFIAPESTDELMGKQWMELQQWGFPAAVCPGEPEAWRGRRGGAATTTSRGRLSSAPARA